MKIVHKIITGIIIFTVLGFTAYQLNQEDQLIIGTWVSEDDTNVQLLFTSDGLQKDIIDGEVAETYNWLITESQSLSGLSISF